MALGHFDHAHDRFVLPCGECCSIFQGEWHLWKFNDTHDDACSTSSLTRVATTGLGGIDWRIDISSIDVDSARHFSSKGDRRSAMETYSIFIGLVRTAGLFVSLSRLGFDGCAGIDRAGLVQARPTILVSLSELITSAPLQLREQANAACTNKWRAGIQYICPCSRYWSLLSAPTVGDCYQLDLTLSCRAVYCD